MRKIKLVCAVASIIALGGIAEAKTLTAKVLKVTRNGSRIIVSTKDTGLITKGDYLKLGDNCDLEVIRSGSSKLILDTDLCENKDVLRIGRTLRLKEEDKAVKAAALDAPSSNSTRTKAISRPKAFTGEIARGLRLSVFRPDLDAETEIKINDFGFDETIKDKQDADAKFQIGVGYADIGLNRVGMIANLSLTRFDDDDGDDGEALRAEGSASFGFAPQIYGFAGLNVNKFTKAEGTKELDPKLGYQLGLGLQASDKLSFELKYITTRNQGNTKVTDELLGEVDLNAEVKLKGIELGVVATF